MRALVLGGTGFIGAAACKELMRRGIETIAASRREHPYGTFTSHLAFDRRDRRSLQRALAEVQPDLLVDLACYRPQEVADVLELFRGARYVFMSSAAVYTQDFHGRAAEEKDFAELPGDPPPETGYGEGKQWCETLLMRSAGFAWVSLRPPYVLGTADHTLRIAAYMQRVDDGGPLLVPEETWERPAELAWVRDVGYACALASDLRREVAGRSYNVAFEGVSLRDLLEGIGRALGKTPRFVPLPFSEIPREARPYGPDPREAAGLAVARARRELGFEPSELEEALAETLAWYRVARPSHAGYAARGRELELAASAR